MALSSPEHDVHVDGPVTALALAADAERLGRWLTTYRGLHRSTDSKAAGAFLLGALAQEVSEILAVAALAGQPTPLPHPKRVQFLLARARWEEPGEVEDVIVHRPRLDGPDAVLSPGGLRLGLEATFAPLVRTLAAQTRLGQGALWRLVTDGAAQALLDAGRTCGDVARGMIFASTMLSARGSPLANRQWGFVELEARRPDGRTVRDWFRARGGCCRFYTVEGGEYCSTCVLRDAESRDARLRGWLATRTDPHPAEPASDAA